MASPNTFFTAGLLGISMAALASTAAANQINVDDNVKQAACENVSLQVLGSGGPELDDGRTSSSYLIWYKDKARVLIDAGSGSSVRFGETGANFADIDTILLSHLHTDHAADLPSFIKGSYFGNRSKDLTIYGPAANDVMPSTERYVQSLIGKNGAFSYLSSYTQKGEDDYLVTAHSVQESSFSTKISHGISVEAMSVHHGPIPALSWKVTVDECVAVFSGDTNNAGGTLAAFAKDVDILVLHNAIGDNAGAGAMNLHMTPKQIITIAKEASPKRVLLSHIMKRSETGIAGLTEAISVIAPGQVFVAQDLMNISLVREGDNF